MNGTRGTTSRRENLQEGETLEGDAGEGAKGADTDLLR